MLSAPRTPVCGFCAELRINSATRVFESVFIKSEIMKNPYLEFQHENLRLCLKELTLHLRVNQNQKDLAKTSLDIIKKYDDIILAKTLELTTSSGQLV